MGVIIGAQRIVLNWQQIGLNRHQKEINDQQIRLNEQQRTLSEYDVNQKSLALRTARPSRPDVSEFHEEMARAARELGIADPGTTGLEQPPLHLRGTEYLFRLRLRFDRSRVIITEVSVDEIGEGPGDDEPRQT